VLLKPLGQLDGVVLVKRLETAPERDVVFLLDEQVVVGLVDDGNVELLRTDEVWLGQGEVVLVLQDLDHSAVVESSAERGEQVRQERRLE
jgi:hypothetical protein